ncbi:uncharacterized protein BDZ99DRAFT_210833 [Mytilinidion resinicola]|uniref:Uncharacterized protein n=1 Tax=Mytilinidion resinicola TaxID=574789 RepID=A0A6A6Y042_9PEZI|nr:uncharacterized protein BDZ99DRAFT_210833 [Mytilinidion resinicola]KAF2802186.1 hypothetical protein BDZ99DRAFT_210833 [Mytilinidion resinicola]
MPELRPLHRGIDPRRGVIRNTNPAYSTLEYQRAPAVRQLAPIAGAPAVAPQCNDNPTCSGPNGGTCSNHVSVCPGDTDRPGRPLFRCHQRDENRNPRGLYPTYPMHTVCEDCQQHGRRAREDEISDLALYRVPAAIDVWNNPQGIQYNPNGRRGLLCRDCTMREIGYYNARIQNVDPATGITIELPVGAPGDNRPFNSYPHAIPFGDPARIPIPAAFGARRRRPLSAP